MLVAQDVFLAGEWVTSTSRQWVDVVSPITEATMGRAPVPTFRELGKAIGAARDAFDDGPWPRLSLDERAACLRTALKIFDDKHFRSAVALQIDETGSVESFVSATTGAMAGFLEHLIEDASEVASTQTRRGVAGPVRVVREPRGVVAGIIPWTAPVLMAATKILPALLMGCSMVLKTAPQSPFSAYLLAQAMLEAGLPPGVLSIVSGGQDIGAYLISHPQIDKVTFTGSTHAGRQIASVCGHHLKPVSCELGGKSAAILTPGADVATHLPALLAHSLTNSGQLRVSTSRLLVHADQGADLRDALIDALSGMTIGDPHDPSVAFGPLVNELHRDRVEGYIASGKAQGATLVYGGMRPGHLPVGYYLTPAVFTGVDNGMAIARDAILGPVLSIIEYSTEAEAVCIANDSEYGLGASIYADDVDGALVLANQLHTGACAINNAPLAGGGGPLGGHKSSGLGLEYGTEGLLEYLQYKSIALPAFR